MTASRPDPLLAIDADGLFRVDAPTGRSISVNADGATLRIDAPGWAELSLLGSRSILAQRRSVVRTARVLATLGLRAHVTVSQRPALQLGAGARPSLLARVLRLGPVHLPLASALALWRNV